MEEWGLGGVDVLMHGLFGPPFRSVLAGRKLAPREECQKEENTKTERTRETDEENVNYDDD
uniref:Uncharacterized protein n=1 Tax=Romanomermis culicivorax TaxID=13658 RepID=A0A915KB46_ROMCU